MPALPEILSTASLTPAFQPTQAVDGLTRAQDILASGMRDVAHAAAGIAGNLTAAQQATDATGAIAKLTMERADLDARYERDPDPATAPARYRAEIEGWNTQALEGIGDPAVRAAVARHQSLAIPSAYQAIVRHSAAAQVRRNVGALGDNLSTLAQAYAQAKSDDDRRLAEQPMKAAIAAGVETGLIDPSTGNRMFSQTLRQALTILAVADPTAASRLLDTRASEMQVHDVAELRQHLRAPVIRQQADGIAYAVSRAGGSSGQAFRDITSGLIARGVQPDDAAALATNVIAESGGNPATKPGDGGASHGLLQWNGDRLERFQNRYGKLPGAATMDEQLDFLVEELGGVEAPAYARIKAAGTVGDKAAAASLAYVRPGRTQAARAAEAERRRALAVEFTTGTGRAGLAEQIREVDARTETLSPDIRLHARQRVIELNHQEAAAQAPERAALHRQVTDLMTSYEAGLTDAAPPVAEIRRLLPFEEARRVEDQLAITRRAGDLYRGVKMASPEEEAAVRSWLAVPGAIAGELPKKDGRVVMPPAGAGGDQRPEPPENMKLRLAVAQKYDELLHRKHQVLRADPAAYAASVDGVAARATARDPATPTTWRTYADASDRVQAQLGVPPEQRRVLANQEVSHWIGQIANADPATLDVGVMLDRFMSQFGDTRLASRAFGELVTQGKLDPDYQILATLTGKDATSPAQAGKRADFQRALSFAAQRGGIEKLRQDAPPDVAKKIRDDLPGTLDDFRQTIEYAGTPGMRLFDAVRTSVEKLAFWYAAQGKSSPVDMAYDAILGDNYDFLGTMRTPKGRMGETRAAVTRIQNALQADNLLALPERVWVPGETETDRREALLRAARNGVWVPNEDSTGLVLIAKLRNGAMVVRTANGRPVEVRFDQLGVPTVAAGPAGMESPEPRGPALGMPWGLP